MTQNKNKKGIAKKALSISLVAAMLATSNVPVWASGFEAVDPEVEGFALEESMAEEPVVENETADDFEDSAVENAYDEQAGYKYDLTIKQNRWGSPAKVEGKVYTGDGENEAPAAFAYEWCVDGVPVTDVDKVFSGEGEDIKPYSPTYDQFGKSLSLHIWADDGKTPATMLYDFQNVSPVKIGQASIAPWAGAFKLTMNGKNVVNGDRFYYNGKEQKATPSVDKFNMNSINNGQDLIFDTENFNFSYSTENCTDAGAVITVTATPTDSALSGTFKLTYYIDRAVASENTIGLTYKTDPEAYTYEFTGSFPDIKDDLVATDLLADKDISDKIVSVVQAGGDYSRYVGSVGGDNTYNKHFQVYFDYDSMNFKGGNAYFDAPAFTIVARQLTNCDISIDPVADSDSKYPFVTNDNRLNNKIHFYDKVTGVEIPLIKGTDYDITFTGDPTKIGTYDVTIQGKGTLAEGKVTAKLTVVDDTFDGAYFSKASYVAEAEPYTGETVTKDIAKLGDFTSNKNTKIDVNNYDISFKGINAGKTNGHIIVTGKGTVYAGAYLDIPFEISAAKVTDKDVTVPETAAFDPSFTSASDYELPVVVKANSYYANGKLAKAFDALERGKDYTVTSTWDKNEVGGTITTKVTIINNNFKGDKTTFTLKTIITKKQFSNVSITAEPASYEYTGKVIKPSLVVMDGDEKLYEGVDYTITVKGGINVGTYEATIKGMGIYDDGTTATVKYTITPADISKVKVSTPAVTYTGKVVKPEPGKISITYNGVNVMDQVRITYPTANINAGKGTLRLTPGTKNKNFTGTADVEFTINPAKLEGTLKVYDGNKAYSVDSNGYLLDSNKQILTFKYEDKAFTFDKVTFTPTGSMAKLVTENDYEIKYIDNKYGTDAYVTVVGKNNFAGASQITNAEGTIVKSVAAYNIFRVEKYTIAKQHVTFGDAEYAGGVAVTPNVKVVVGGRTLKESQDYILDYKIATDLSTGKTLKVTVTGINGYEGTVSDYVAVVKKNLANCDITVKNGVVTVMNGKVVVPSSEYTVAQNTDGNYVITAKADSKYYTGSAIVDGVNVPDATVLRVTDRTTSTVSLAWNEVEGAEGYTIWFRSEYDTKVSRKIIQGGDVTSWKQNGLQPGTKYFYTVRAWVKDSEDNYVFGDQSPVQRGTTKPVAAAIKSVSSDNGYVKVVLAGKAAGAKMYSMCYSKSMNGFESNDFKVGIRTSYTTRTFTKALSAGTYYVRVKSYRDLGNSKRVYGAWSNTMKVVVK